MRTFADFSPLNMELNQALFEPKFLCQKSRKMKKLFFLILYLIGMSCATQPNHGNNPTTPEAVVDKLDQLGYFKYTDPQSLELAKEGLRDCIASGIYDPELQEEAFISLDYRYYMLDGESLFEMDGVPEALNDFKRLFEKMGFPCEITDHLDFEMDTEEEELEMFAKYGFTEEECFGENKFITLNGKQYILLKAFTSDDYTAWAHVPQRFALMINDQMKIHGFEERLYLISGGNEGLCVFLTEAQFSLLDSLDLAGRPQDVVSWCASQEIDMEDYDHSDSE